MIKGKQSIAFEVSPYLEESASVVGKKEGEGPLGGMFDMVAEEDLFGENTWEEAESTMQKEACLLALGKAHLAPESIRYLFGGDLLRQGVATSMGVETLQIPMFGLYGACSTSGEALALASMSVAAGYGERMLAVTSSHFGSAEKEFRFPLGYANQRPLSAHWTVTGSGAFIVGKNRSHVRITGVTVGKIVDYGLKDSQNMGACMAPAATDTIYRNFQDLGRTQEDYDQIITGDLGYIGQSILFDLMKRAYDVKHWKCTKPEMPVLFISGAEDPCMGNVRQFAKAVRAMRRAGYRDVRGKLYPGMRHEILNEKGKEKVWHDVFVYMKKKGF